MYVFSPFRRNTSPSRRAVVSSRNVLDPALASVTAKHHFSLPSAMPGSQRRFPSSVPFRRMQAASMMVTTISALPKPAAPNSSMAKV